MAYHQLSFWALLLWLPLHREPLVAQETNTVSGPYKTSIVFSLKEGPGQLFKALSVFALRDIDMTKIESRPMRTNPIVHAKGSMDAGGPQLRFNYLFYVDFVGSLADQQSQNALRHLQVSRGAQVLSKSKQKKKH
jgi:arogenate/prephenate dehydratase